MYHITVQLDLNPFRVLAFSYITRVFRGVEDGHWARQLWLQIGEPNEPIDDSIATSFIVKKCACIIVLEESEEKVVPD